MGQKISPKSFRLAFNKNWDSNWYASKSDYSTYVIEDNLIRETINHHYSINSGISLIKIRRNPQEIEIDILSSKPGIIIGRQGKGITELKNLLEKRSKSKIRINILEIKKADLDARLVGNNIANQINKRFPFRRAMKMSIEKVMNAGAKGVKIKVSGRLQGAEIARSESHSEGAMPMSSIDKNIDYAIIHAQTTYGIIGIKVWIYKGDIDINQEMAPPKQLI